MSVSKSVASPFVVKYSDMLHEVLEGYILVMPLFCETLAAFTESLSGSVAPEPLAAHICLSVLAAIVAISEAGYVHGDIKPSNTMFDHNGNITVIDLGSCVRVGQDLTESTKFYCHGLSGNNVQPSFDLRCAAASFAPLCVSECPGTAPTEGYLQDLASRDTHIAAAIIGMCLDTQHPRQAYGDARDAVGRRFPGVLARHEKLVSEMLPLRVSDESKSESTITMGCMLAALLEPTDPRGVYPPRAPSDGLPPLPEDTADVEVKARTTSLA
jgi:serine/threonine protein kinase